MPQSESPRVLLLYTETGGTHGNAARAIIEAVKEQAGHQCQLDLVDVWQYAKFPMKYLPRMIFWFRERRPVSNWHFRNSHNRSRLDSFKFLAHGYLQKATKKILAEHSYDLIISVHPITSAPVLDVLAEDTDIPFWVVVTDIATRNVFWFDQRASKTIVPTVKALNFAAQSGISFERLCLQGVPVPKGYYSTSLEKTAFCREMKMDPQHPLIIVAGGKEGVGPVDEVAQRIDERFSNINLLVLTGKNHSLFRRLSEYNWNNSTHVFGYVNDLWRLMWAADIMVTKAGTGMLAEALSVGLPMILFHRVPYLEDANVSFLVENGAAFWAPTSRMVVNALSLWLEDRSALQSAQKACHTLAKPKVAVTLGKMIISTAEHHFEQSNGNKHDDSE